MYYSTTSISSKSMVYKFYNEEYDIIDDISENTHDD